MLASESTFWICLGKCAQWLLEIQDSRNRLSEWGVICISIWYFTVPSRSVPRAKFSVHFFWLGLASSPGCLTSRQVLGGPCVSAYIAYNKLSATSMSHGCASPILRCRLGARKPSSCCGSQALP